MTTQSPDATTAPANHRTNQRSNPAMSPDANDFLMGGGGKSATFPTPGATVTGRILRTPEVRQQTTPEGTPKTFDNGDPMMQLVVQLATDQRDPQDAEDDGTRGLYIKSNMLAAVREAVRKTGAKGLDVGGTLTVTYVSDGEKKRAAHNAPKLYTATYQPPTAQAANDFLNGGGNGHNSPPPTQAIGNADAYLAAQQQAAALAAAQAAAATAPPAPIAAPPPGVDPALWGQLTTEQRASVLAATNNVRT